MSKEKIFHVEVTMDALVIAETKEEAERMAYEAVQEDGAEGDITVWEEPLTPALLIAWGADYIPYNSSEDFSLEERMDLGR